MKGFRFLVPVLALLMAMAVGSGCRPKPKPPTPIPSVTGSPTGRGAPTYGTDERVGTVPVDRGTPVGVPIDPGTQGGPGTGDGTEGMIPMVTSLADMKEDRGFFSANTVYFDFDRSAIKSNERGKVEAVADYLKSNPTHAVKVEGHCDERGTEGYNLALGERRALAVREYLVNLGISGERVATISYGEARPAVEGHSEAAWSKNRRGEFILLTP